MKLKYKMTVMDMDGELTAVPMESEEDFRGILRVNETAAAIIGLLEEETTEDEVVAALRREYNATDEQLRSSVRRTVAVLKEKHLLEDESVPKENG